MKKLIIAILSLLSTCSPSLAQTWAGTASNQWATATRLQDAVTTSVFTKIQPFYENASKWITRDSAMAYVAIQPVTAKASNQYLKKSDYVAKGVTGCAINDSIDVSVGTGLTNPVYFNLGTISYTPTLSYNVPVPNGYSIGVYYGGVEIKKVDSASTGSSTFTYTYNANYGTYVRVQLELPKGYLAMNETPFSLIPNESLAARWGPSYDPNQGIGMFAVSTKYFISPSCYSPATIYVYGHYTAGQLLIDVTDAAGGTGNHVNVNCALSGTIQYTQSPGPGGSYNWTIPIGQSTWSQSGITNINAITTFTGSPATCGASTYNYNHE